MKRASYRHGVEIIALNDEAEETDVETVSGMISVCLLADLFGVEPLRVAGDVVRYRKDAAFEPGAKREKIWSRA